MQIQSCKNLLFLYIKYIEYDKQKTKVLRLLNLWEILYLCRDCVIVLL